MRRGFLLGFAAVLVFAMVAGILTQIMPPPLKNSDYVIIGSVATLVAMMAVFVALIATSKGQNVFFKRRRKER